MSSKLPLEAASVQELLGTWELDEMTFHDQAAAHKPKMV